MKDHPQPSRFLRLPLLALAVAILSGCGQGTYHVSCRMPPDNAITLRVKGDEPFVLVRNGGPGSLHLTFDAGASGLVESGDLAAGVARGSTVKGDKVVRIETGDEEAGVEIEAQRASGFILNGPRPKAEGR